MNNYSTKVLSILQPLTRSRAAFPTPPQVTSEVSKDGFTITTVEDLTGGCAFDEDSIPSFSSYFVVLRTFLNRLWLGTSIFGSMHWEEAQEPGWGTHTWHDVEGFAKVAMLINRDTCKIKLEFFSKD